MNPVWMEAESDGASPTLTLARIRYAWALLGGTADEITWWRPGLLWHEWDRDG